MSLGMADRLRHGGRRRRIAPDCRGQARWGQPMQQLLQFTCPNGHKLSSPPEGAGQAAKCPKCGVRFRVPAAEELQAGQAGTPATMPSDTIFFLCPNGHELHGSKRLAGRAGKCPHCGEKFQIPTLEEMAAAAEAEAQAAAQAPAGTEPNGEPATEEASADAYAAAPQPPPDGYDTAPQDYTPAEDIYELTDVEIIDDDLPPAHPLGLLVERLWAQRDEGVVFEIHLTGGGNVQAQRFAPRLSRGAHGVFSARQENGQYTLFMVAWDQVQRVVLRNLDELPEEMFD